jgi:hypothetical protein
MARYIPFVLYYFRVTAELINMAQPPKLPRAFNFNLVSPAYKQTLYHRFERKSEQINGCRVWTGAKNSSGYPQTKIKDPESGENIVLSVHRVVFGLQSNRNIDNPGYQVSHLCHNRACIQYNHLNFETAATNTQRSRQCVPNRACEGHVNEPNCLFQGQN